METPNDRFAQGISIGQGWADRRQARFDKIKKEQDEKDDANLSIIQQDLGDPFKLGRMTDEQTQQLVSQAQTIEQRRYGQVHTKSAPDMDPAIYQWLEKKGMTAGPHGLDFDAQIWPEFQATFGHLADKWNFAHNNGMNTGMMQSGAAPPTVGGEAQGPLIPSGEQKAPASGQPQITIVNSPGAPPTVATAPASAPISERPAAATPTNFAPANEWMGIPDSSAPAAPPAPAPTATETSALPSAAAPGLPRPQPGALEVVGSTPITSGADLAQPDRSIILPSKVTARTAYDAAKEIYNQYYVPKTTIDDWAAGIADTHSKLLSSAWNGNVLLDESEWKAAYAPSASALYQKALKGKVDLGVRFFGLQPGDEAGYIDAMAKAAVSAHKNDGKTQSDLYFKLTTQLQTGGEAARPGVLAVAANSGLSQAYITALATMPAQKQHEANTERSAAAEKAWKHAEYVTTHPDPDPQAAANQSRQARYEAWVAKGMALNPTATAADFPDTTPEQGGMPHNWGPTGSMSADQALSHTERQASFNERKRQFGLRMTQSEDHFTRTQNRIANAPKKPSAIALKLFVTKSGTTINNLNEKLTSARAAAHDNFDDTKGQALEQAVSDAEQALEQGTIEYSNKYVNGGAAAIYGDGAPKKSSGKAKGESGDSDWRELANFASSLPAGNTYKAGLMKILNNKNATGQDPRAILMDVKDRMRK